MNSSLTVLPSRGRVFFASPRGKNTSGFLTRKTRQGVLHSKGQRRGNNEGCLIGCFAALLIIPGCGSAGFLSTSWYMRNQAAQKQAEFNGAMVQQKDSNSLATDSALPKAGVSTNPSPSSSPDLLSTTSPNPSPTPAPSPSLSSNQPPLPLTHTVEAGESLTSIARKYFETDELIPLLRANEHLGLSEESDLEVGQIINIQAAKEGYEALTSTPSPSPEPTNQSYYKQLQERASEFVRSFLPGNHLGGLASRRHG